MGGVPAGWFDWTDRRVEALKRLQAAGLSASMIADELGGGVTRNAVIAKIHRLGIQRGRQTGGQTLSRRQRSGINANIPRRVAAKIARKEAGLDKPQPKLFALETKGGPIGPIVSLVHLNETRCRWPVGEVTAETFGYCGHATEQAPYCPHHSGIAFTTPSQMSGPIPPARGYVCESIKPQAV